MKTYYVGETIILPEYDGMISKTISAIFWRMNGKGNNAVEKLAVLSPAMEWSIILFTDGTWINGNEIQIPKEDKEWIKDQHMRMLLEMDRIIDEKL